MNDLDQFDCRERRGKSSPDSVVPTKRMLAYILADVPNRLWSVVGANRYFQSSLKDLHKKSGGSGVAAIQAENQVSFFSVILAADRMAP